LPDARTGTANRSIDYGLDSSLRWGSAGGLPPPVVQTNRRWGTAEGFPPPVVQTNRRAPTDLPTLLAPATDSPDARTGTANRSIDYGLESSRRAPTDSPTLEQFGKPVPGSIPTILWSYKSAVAYRLNLIRRTPGAAIWQRNYYEHIIHDEAEYHRIARYILENPAGWASDNENRPQENDHA